MKKHNFTPRNNYQETNENLGLDFGVVNNHPYWNESTAYSFTMKEIDKIEKATNELHQMCFQAIQYIIDNNKFKQMNIPDHMISLIKQSWNEEDWSMYGRFDLCVKDNKIKMLEYNADTPTSLLEASLIQWKWKEDKDLPDQFNSIEEKLIDWWKAYKEEYQVNLVHFTAVKENSEDYRNVEYIKECATKAGLTTEFIFIEDIGSDGEYLYDLEDNPIEVLFKLYPLEWMAKEDSSFLAPIVKRNCKIVEPVWKMLLSNKALLAVLWEMFPHHEYLLETYFDNKKFKSTTYVKKPFLSREGQNVEIIDSVSNKEVESKSGLYGSDFNIYQQYFPLPKFDDQYVVVGSWIVGEEACGIGLRQDSAKITANLSQFCPHFIEDNKTFVNNSSERTRTLEDDLFDQDNAKKTSTGSLKNKSEAYDYGYDNSSNSDKKNFVQKWMGILVGVALIGLGVYGLTTFISFIGQENSKVEQENKATQSYNDSQKQALFSMIKQDKSPDVANWINSYVDKNNQEVFKAMYELNRQLVIEGINSKDKFLELDKKLGNLLFCVQGEKDIKLVGEFMDNIMYDYQSHKTAINFLKNKYNISQNKVDVPNEEEILEMCSFKNFEQDLKDESTKFNSGQTDDTKKVIVEDIN